MSSNNANVIQPDQSLSAFRRWNKLPVFEGSIWVFKPSMQNTVSQLDSIPLSNADFGLLVKPGQNIRSGRMLLEFPPSVKCFNFGVLSLFCCHPRWCPLVILSLNFLICLNFANGQRHLTRDILNHPHTVCTDSDSTHQRSGVICLLGVLSHSHILLESPATVPAALSVLGCSSANAARHGRYGSLCDVPINSNDTVLGRKHLPAAFPRSAVMPFAFG